MIIILFGICILRTVLLFTIMPRWHDIRGIAVTYPITWGMTALCMMDLGKGVDKYDKMGLFRFSELPHGTILVLLSGLACQPLLRVYWGRGGRKCC